MNNQQIVKDFLLEIERLSYNIKGDLYLLSDQEDLVNVCQKTINYFTKICDEAQSKLDNKNDTFSDKYSLRELKGEQRI